MEQVFEIVLNNFNCKEFKEENPVNKNKNRKVIKNLKWLKYYF